MSGEKELMKYTVKDWSIRKTSTGIEVALVLGRKILNEILTTYLPRVYWLSLSTQPTITKISFLKQLSL